MTPNECFTQKTAEKTDDYNQILELAEQGQTEQALARIQKYLDSDPCNAEVLNDTGAILFSLGRTEEAISYLEKARALSPDSAEIIWNSIEAWLAANTPHKAMEQFEKMKELGILSADVLNRTSDVLLKNENFSDAARVLRWSLEMSPEQEILHPMIDVISSKLQENTD